MLSQLTTFLLPQTCALCRENTQNCRICEPCTQELPWQIYYCPRCATPSPSNILCGRCIMHPPAFDQVICPLIYQDSIQHLITQLKFHEKICYANAISDLLFAALKPFYQQHPKPEIILPVPLSKKRLQERGYNQALEIAKPIAKKLNIPLDANLLKKTKDTIPQSELNFSERLSNIRNSFMLSAPLQYRNIAILDDVITTGSTVNEIAKLLKKQGAKKVIIWGIARTYHH